MIHCDSNKVAAVAAVASVAVQCKFQFSKKTTKVNTTKADAARAMPIQPDLFQELKMAKKQICTLGLPSAVLQVVSTHVPIQIILVESAFQTISVGKA